MVLTIYLEAICPRSFVSVAEQNAKVELNHEIQFY